MLRKQMLLIILLLAAITLPYSYSVTNIGIVKYGNEIIAFCDDGDPAPNELAGYITVSANDIKMLVSESYVWDSNVDEFVLTSTSEIKFPLHPGIHTTLLGAKISIVHPTFLGTNAAFWKADQVRSVSIGYALSSAYPQLDFYSGEDSFYLFKKSGTSYYYKETDLDSASFLTTFSGGLKYGGIVASNTDTLESGNVIEIELRGVKCKKKMIQWSTFSSSASFYAEQTYELAFSDFVMVAPPPARGIVSNSDIPQPVFSLPVVDHCQGSMVNAGLFYNLNKLPIPCRPNIFSNTNWALFPGRYAKRVKKTLEDDNMLSDIDGGGVFCLSGQSVSFYGNKVSPIVSPYRIEYTDDNELHYYTGGDAYYKYEHSQGDWYILTSIPVNATHVITYSYSTVNNASRLDAIGYPDGSATTFTYTSGYLSKITKHNGDFVDFDSASGIYRGTLYGSTDTLATTPLRRYGWSYTGELLDKVYTYSGSDLSTAIERIDYSYDNITISSIDIDGIQCLFDEWISAATGSCKASITDGTDTINFEREIEYGENHIYGTTRYKNGQTELFSSESAINKLGLIAAATSSLGGKTEYTWRYDEDPGCIPSRWFELLSKTDAEGKEIEYIYAATDVFPATYGLPLEVKLNDKQSQPVSSVSREFDENGRVLLSGVRNDSNTDWLISNEYTYEHHDSLDKKILVETEDGEGRVSNYVRNATGHLIAFYVDDSTAYYAYNDEGWLYRVHTDDATAYINYHSSGRIAAVGINGASTQFGYANYQYGLLTDVTGPAGSHISYSHDNLGRLIQKTFNCSTLNASATYEYDNRNRIAKHTLASGKSLAYSYNFVGHVTQVDYLDANDVPTASVELTYNDRYRVSNVRSHCGEGCSDSIDYGYDSQNRITYRTGIGYGALAFTYDDAGRMGGFAWPARQDDSQSDGAIVYKDLSFHFDRAQRISQISHGSNGEPLISYAYNRASQETDRILENDVSMSHTYDGTYGLMSDLDILESDESALLCYDLTYDDAGCITSATSLDGASNEYSYAYAYDTALCLEEEHKKVGQSTIYKNEYAYDLAGNRLLHSYSTSSTTQSYYCEYNDLNQLTQRTWNNGTADCTQEYEYNIAGQLIKKTELIGAATDAIWEYSWDTVGRLVEVVEQDGSATVVKTVEYAYCPSCGGQRTHRIVKSSTGALLSWHRFESSGINQLRVDERYDADANGLDDSDPFRMKRVSFNGPGMVAQLIKEILYNYVSDTTAVLQETVEIFYHYDFRGCVAALSDANGNLLQVFDTDAFGSWDGEDAYTTRRLTGKQYDPDTGLYFFENRWYDPEVGRFISRDRLSFAELSEGMNLYAFVANDPISYVDPLGLKLSEPGNSHGACDGSGSDIGSKAGYDRFLDDIMNGRDIDEVVCNPSNGGAPEWLGDTGTGIWDGLDVTMSFSPLGDFWDAGVFVGGVIFTGEIDLGRAWGIVPFIPGAISKVCFVAGTEISTPNGMVPIEDIQVGDLVLSWNEEKGVQELRPVLSTSVLTANKLILIETDGGSERIEVTPEHPFMVEGRGWVDARHLQPGDILTTKDGSPTRIESIQPIEIRAGPVAVYNFEVDVNPSYYVSSEQILVHNRRLCKPPKAPKPPRGFQYEPESITLEPGTIIDRYGSPNGHFAAPEGTPFRGRSMPAAKENEVLHTYVVVEPIRVDAGPAAPHSGQPGWGPQYDLGPHRSFEDLWKAGILEEIYPHL
jgi:RHS repeat-associated protein